MPTKIETHLSHEELLEFFRRCAQTKGGTTLRAIQAIAEEFGVRISLMSATAVRDGPLASYLDEIRSSRENTEAIVAIAKEGLGVTDAAAAVLGRSILDKSLRLASQGDEASLDETDVITKSLKRLRDGDQKARYLESKLREMERAQMEWEEQRNKIKEQADKLRNAKTEDADTVRAAVVDQIDRIMGLKK